MAQLHFVEVFTPSDFYSVIAKRVLLQELGPSCMKHVVMKKLDQKGSEMKQNGVEIKERRGEQKTKSTSVPRGKKLMPGKQVKSAGK